jgi:hypothetical protein
MSFTNYLEEKLLKHVLTNTAYTAPATVYVGLFTAAPGETGGGTEVSGGAYARQAGAFTVTAGNPSEAVTSAAIEFPAASASWGTVTYAGVFDAATGGNLLCFAELTDPATFTTALPKTITTGDVLRINAGNLKVRLD